MDFIERCRKFIELDSTPATGTAEIAQFAASLCREAGLHVEIQTENENGVEQANIIARPRAFDEGLRPKDELLLQTHLDTYDPGAYALWTKTGANPFHASIYTDPSDSSETLYGLGAASAKLDFLCKLQALIELGPREWKVPPVLVGTFGEETGMHGAVRLIRKKKISASMALISEPTEMKLVCAGKGFAGVEIEVPFSDDEKEMRRRHDMSDGSSSQTKMFKGKAAHSSSPEAGESAVAKMVDYLSKLPDGIVIMEMEGGVSFNTIPSHSMLEIDLAGGLKDTIGPKIARITSALSQLETEFAKYVDRDFDPAVPTLNIGIVKTFEDFIKLSGCCRLPPSVTDEVYQGWMEILRSACDEVGAAFRVTEYKQPFRTSVDHPLVGVCQQELEKRGLSRNCGAQSVANEANVFSRFGIRCVVVGPGQGVGNSHAPNEHVRISQLTEATSFYKSVIERVCL